MNMFLHQYSSILRYIKIKCWHTGDPRPQALLPKYVNRCRVGFSLSCTCTF